MYLTVSFFCISPFFIYLWWETFQCFPSLHSHCLEVRVNIPACVLSSSLPNIFEMHNLQRKKTPLHKENRGGGGDNTTLDVKK